MLIRSYALKHHLNEAKIATILEIFPHYRKLAKHISKIQWGLFFYEYKFNKNLDIKQMSSFLSERYKQTCQYQVVSQLQGYIENIKLKFKSIVYKYNFDTETRIQLLYINKYGLWLKRDILLKGLEIPSSIKKIAHKIFRHLLNINRKPNMSRINMNLDAKVAKISKSTDGEFDYWVNLSTHIKGKPVEVPLKTNAYFESQVGTLKNFVQVNLKNNNIEFRVIKEHECKEYETTGEVISLDTGLVNLLATNHGDLFGKKIYEYLKVMDTRITDLVKALSNNGVKPSKSNRYRSMVNKIRSYLKNEISRIVNRIVELYRPGMIVIEKLNFQNTNLSRRMNRIISNFGLGRLHTKLEAISEEYGIEIVEVNPAYTSQECSSCHYVSKENRASRDTFECVLCEKKIHADVNGARNIIARSSCDDISVWVKYKNVLNILRKRFLGYIERDIRLYSMAMRKGIVTSVTDPASKICFV